MGPVMVLGMLLLSLNAAKSYEPANRKPPAEGMSCLFRGCPTGSACDFYPNVRSADLLPGEYLCRPLIPKKAPVSQ